MTTMPDLSKLLKADRVAAMAAWLQENSISYDTETGDVGVRSKWQQMKNAAYDAARRKREHNARAASSQPAAPLASRNYNV